MLTKVGNGYFIETCNDQGNWNRMNPEGFDFASIDFAFAYAKRQILMPLQLKGKAAGPINMFRISKAT